GQRRSAAAAGGTPPEGAYFGWARLALQRRPHAGVQEFGRLVTGCPAQGIAEIGGLGREVLAFGAGLQMPLGRIAFCAIELAVQITLGRKDVIAAHRNSFALSRNWVRARARRDITVPMGVPVMSAISR